MNAKMRKAYDAVIKQIEAVAKSMPLVDYHELLTELADELEARLEAIKNESGLV